MNRQQQQPSEVQLTGGVVQSSDGTFQVECVFSGMTEQEARFLSVWLERLICVHMKEVINPCPRAMN
jgi:hypothetical protein